MVKLLAHKRSHQLTKHRLRTIPAIVTELELAQILREMLLADMNVRAIDRALEDHFLLPKERQ